MKKPHPTLPAHEIIPRLWQGSFPGPGDKVRNGGIDMLVLCARELQPPATSYPGVEVVHAPNDDSIEFPLTRAKLTQALHAARRVVAAHKDGKSILVTCAAGMNRSGLVSGLALHLLFGWPGDMCVRQVRERRGSKGQLAPLSNPEFSAALKRLQTKDPTKLASHLLVGVERS